MDFLTVFPPFSAALRAVMAADGLAGYIVPRADAHQGEDVPDAAVLVHVSEPKLCFGVAHTCFCLFNGPA